MENSLNWAERVMNGLCPSSECGGKIFLDRMLSKDTVHAQILMEDGVLTSSFEPELVEIETWTYKCDSCGRSGSVSHEVAEALKTGGSHAGAERDSGL